jgi:hypothetical protein
MPDLIIDHVKGCIDRQLTTLAPDADITPALVTVGKRGINTLLLGIPVDPTDHEELMKAVMAYLILTEAENTVFAATAWSVSATAGGTGVVPGSAMSLSPGADRREVVMLTYASRDGHAAVHTAEVLRRTSQPPVIGFWSERESEHGLTGTIGEAIEVGLRLAGDLILPESHRLRGYLDSLWETFDVPHIVKTVSDGLRRVGEVN